MFDGQPVSVRLRSPCLSLTMYRNVDEESASDSVASTPTKKIRHSERKVIEYVLLFEAHYMRADSLT